MAGKKKKVSSKPQDTKPEIKVESKEQEKKETSRRMTSKEKIYLLQHEIAEIMDQKLRIVAEFENFRRRNLIEKANWIKNATERLVLEICDVRDNFERALHADNEKSDANSLREGVDLIFQQLEDVLKKEGVSKINALGQKFDPNYHDALAHIPSHEKENIVIAVIQNGYIMKNKMIRPVRVAVSNGEKPVELDKRVKKENENK